MKKACNAHGNSESGFNLLELMISLLLSSVIIICLLHHYITIKQQVIAVNDTIHEQTDLLWMYSLIKTTIHQAGFTPCGNIKHLINNQSLTDVWVENVDRLHLYHMAEPLGRVLEVIDTQQLQLNNVVFPENLPIMIADCHHAETNSIIASKKFNRVQIITLSQPLRFNYSKPIYVGSWVTDTFMINKHSLMHIGRSTDQLSSLIQNMEVHKKNNLLDLELQDRNAKSLHVVAVVRQQ